MVSFIYFTASLLRLPSIITSRKNTGLASKLNFARVCLEQCSMPNRDLTSAKNHWSLILSFKIFGFFKALPKLVRKEANLYISILLFQPLVYGSSQVNKESSLCPNQLSLLKVICQCWPMLLYIQSQAVLGSLGQSVAVLSGVGSIQIIFSSIFQF